MLTPLVSVSVVEGFGYSHLRAFRLRMVEQSPPSRPRATHARTLPLRYLTQSNTTTFKPRIASYECPMRYRTFSRSNVGRAAENCLTLNFASVCFPRKIRAFLPEDSTMLMLLDRSSKTSLVRLKGAEDHGISLAAVSAHQSPERDWRLERDSSAGRSRVLNDPEEV